MDAPPCVQAGRMAGASESVAVLSVVIIQVIGPNPDRVSITFSADTAGAFVSTMADMGGAGGLSVAPASGPVTLSVQTHGQMVQRAWFGQMAAATGTLHIFEASMN